MFAFKKQALIILLMVIGKQNLFDYESSQMIIYFLMNFMKMRQIKINFLILDGIVELKQDLLSKLWIYIHCKKYKQLYLCYILYTVKSANLVFVNP